MWPSVTIRLAAREPLGYGCMQSSFYTQSIREKQRSVFFQKTWWMFAFISICLLIFFSAMKKKGHTISDLEHKLAQLEEEKSAALEKKEDLLLQISSFADPAWVEMVLMKRLGVVPEGQVKVYFKKDE